MFLTIVSASLIAIGFFGIGTELVAETHANVRRHFLCDERRFWRRGRVRARRNLPSDSFGSGGSGGCDLYSQRGRVSNHRKSPLGQHRSWLSSTVSFEFTLAAHRPWDFRTPELSARSDDPAPTLTEECYWTRVAIVL